jgi:hypothetical protein
VLAKSRGVFVLALLYASTASGQGLPDEKASSTTPSEAAQVVYKGVVGNLLEQVPLDSEDRVQLQRMNALLSTPLSARAFAIAIGVAHPPLMLAGLIWGLWSATKITPTASQRLQLPGKQTSPRFNESSVGTIHRPEALTLELLVNARVRDEPRPLGSPGFVPRYAATTELAAVAGGAAPSDRAVPCDDCVMPLLYPRVTPVTR